MYSRNRLTETQRQGMSERINQIVQLKCKERQSQHQFSSSTENTNHQNMLTNQSMRRPTLNDTSRQPGHFPASISKPFSAATPQRSADNSAVKNRGYQMGSVNQGNTVYTYSNTNSNQTRGSFQSLPNNGNHNLKSVTPFGQQEYFESMTSGTTGLGKIAMLSPNSNQGGALRRFDEQQIIMQQNKQQQQQQLLQMEQLHVPNEEESQLQSDEHLFVQQIRIQENRIAQLEELLRKEVLSFEEQRTQMRILKAELLKSQDALELAPLFREAYVISQDEQVDVLISLRQIAAQIQSEVGLNSKNDVLVQSISNENADLKKQLADLSRQLQMQRLQSEQALKKRDESSGLKKDFDDLQKVCAALEKQVEEQAMLLDKKSGEGEQETKKLQASLRDRGNRLIQVECSLKEEREEKAKLNQMLEESRGRLKQSEDEMNELTGYAKSLEDENTAIQAAIEQLQRSNQDQLQGSVDEMKRRYEDEVRRVQDEVKRQQEETRRVAEELRKSQEEVKRVQDEVKRVQDEARRVQEQSQIGISDSSLEIQTLREKNSAKAAKISDLEVRIQEEKHQSTVAAVAISKLKSEIDDLKMMLDSANAAATQVQQQQQQLSDKAGSNSSNSKNVQTAELQKAQSELVKANGELAKAQGEIGRLQTEMKRRQEEQEQESQLRKEEETHKAGEEQEVMQYLQVRVQQLERIVLELAEKLQVEVEQVEDEEVDIFEKVIKGIHEKVDEALIRLSKGNGEGKEGEGASAPAAADAEQIMQMEMKMENLIRDKFILETFVHQVKEFVPNEGVLSLLNEYCECVGTFIEVESRQKTIEEAMKAGENLDNLERLAQETNADLVTLAERKEALERDISQVCEFENQKYAVAEELFQKQQQQQNDDIHEQLEEDEEDQEEAGDENHARLIHQQQQQQQHHRLLLQQQQHLYQQHQQQQPYQQNGEEEDFGDEPEYGEGEYDEQQQYGEEEEDEENDN